MVAASRVLWIRHNESGSGDQFDPALGAVRVMSGLQPNDYEPLLR
ncbi:MAG: hypothetical protein QM747_18120 [Nocardioides sp.]